MNIAQIKRFVNSGLIPIDKMIGRENDNNENSLYSRQKKMLIDLDVIKQGIVNIKDAIASTGSSDCIYTLDGEKEIVFQSSVSVDSDNTWRKIFQFVPEHSGLVEITIQAPSTRHYAILEWGKLTSAHWENNSAYAQGVHLQTLLQTQIGDTTNFSYQINTGSANNAILYESINSAIRSYPANETLSSIVPVQKGQPVIGLSWGSPGGYCVTEIKANKKAL